MVMFLDRIVCDPADSEKNEKDRCGGVDLPFDRCVFITNVGEKSGCRTGPYEGDRRIDLTEILSMIFHFHPDIPRIICSGDGTIL